MLKKGSKKGNTISRKKSLLAKMLFFIGLPVVIIFCLTAVIVLNNVKQSVTQLTTSQLTADSQSVSNQINNYFSKYSEILTQMKANELIKQYLEEPVEVKTQYTFQGYKGIKQTIDSIYSTDSGNLCSVWVADCASNTMASNVKYSLYQVTLSDMPWYQSAIDKKDIVVVEPYEDAVTGTTVMSMVSPVYKSGTSDPIGFVGIDITTNQLYETVKNQKIGQTGFCILATANGQIIYHPDAALKGKNVSESNMSKNIISAIQNKTTGTITYTTKNQTNYGYLSTVGSTGWTVTTGLPESEFGSSYYSTMIYIVMVFTIAAIILLILIVLVSKSIVNPLKKLRNTANEIADGNLNVSLQVKTSDEVGQVATAFSRTVSRLKQYIAYIDEISSVLNQVAVGDLTFELHCDYVGEFSKIRDSLDNIKSTLVKAFSEINTSADEVANGSGQVSNASQSLAQGAAVQASSIEELSAAISEISTKVKVSAADAAEASKNMNEVSSELNENSKQMQDMIAAMSKIRDSSNQIERIIKTIDDIAFQTNILALNAAVEAARAGVAGKGFAVVADEVRNLASRSADAAKETTALIQNSINEVQVGTEIADATASALLRVVEHANDVTTAVNHISQTTNEQANSISQVTMGVEQISSVVQTNSATAEESAAASRELSSQAETLKTLVKRFKFERISDSDGSVESSENEI
jgi:methyl-accepting chemotaxis protein